MHLFHTKCVNVYNNKCSQAALSGAAFLYRVLSKEEMRCVYLCDLH